MEASSRNDQRLRGDILNINSPFLSEIHIFEDALDIGVVLELFLTISTTIEGYSVDNFREDIFLLFLWPERIHETFVR